MGSPLAPGTLEALQAALTLYHRFFTTLLPFLTPADQADYKQFRQAIQGQLTEVQFTTA